MELRMKFTRREQRGHMKVVQTFSVKGESAMYNKISI